MPTQPSRGPPGVVIALLATLALGCSATATSEGGGFLERSGELSPWIVQHRRSLHRIPERLFELHKTSAYVRRQLDALGIRYRFPVAVTGIAAEIGSGSPVVVLRADMDALPIHEETGLDFASGHEGNMHACGHDAHTAMLLGAARMLKEAADSGALPDGSPFPAGTVRLVFQPAEEGGAGGLRMAEEGVLEGASAAFGMHIWPSFETGVVASRVGTIMAGAAEFDLHVEGRGSHAAIPQLASDPVVVGSAIVQALQSLVSRETDPLEAAVVSLTRFVAGDGLSQAHNVIPDRVLVGGTLRANELGTMERLTRRIAEVSAEVASAFGASAEVDWLPEKLTPYPPLVNDAGAVRLALAVAADLLGPSNVLPEAPGTMAGEDFAFFAQRIPSAFLFLGNRNDTLGTVHGLHTSRYTVDEQVLPKGAALHAAIATRFLLQNGAGAANDEL